MQKDRDDLIVVCGAGGFIGGHLVADLLRQGHRRIRAVDIKPLDEWYQRFPDVENLRLDLQEQGGLRRPRCAARPIVYNLAADMGGMGFIENNRALCMLSVLINTHLLMAAHEFGVAALLLLRRRPASMRPTSSCRNERRAAQGRRRVSGHAGRRLRLGEAVQRAHVPALPRGLRRRRRAWPAITTCTGRTARGRADARRRPRRSAAR